MKKEIMNIIKNGGCFTVNEAISLDREVGARIAGEEVDKLTARIKVVGIKGWYNTEIISREYNGIIEELNAAIEKAYAEAASNLCKRGTANVDREQRLPDKLRVFRAYRRVGKRHQRIRQG